MIPINTDLNRLNFLKFLDHNPGLVIVKFGAEWCKPCQRSTLCIEDNFDKLPENVSTVNIDIDNNIDLYVYMKHIKMVQSIPSLLCYVQGNYTFYPDESVSSSNHGDINQFFDRCLLKLET